MSNTIYITVGEFSTLGDSDSKSIVVIVGDSYGDAHLTFDDVDHLLDVYPTEADLIEGVLQLPAFDGVGKREGDKFVLIEGNSLVVQGYPNR